MMSVGRKIVIFLLMISLQVVSGNAFSKPYIERSSAQIVVAVNTDESRLSPENKVLAVSDADQHIDRVPQRGVASALAVPSGQSRERVSLPLAG